MEKKEVGDALRSGENISMETERGGQSRRDWAKKFLVGYIQEKTVVAEKIHPTDRQRDWSQLKRPVKPVGAKP